MEVLYKKLLELSSLLKAVKATNPKPVGFSVPKIKPIKPPAMKTGSTEASAKMPGMAPDAKKDPRKIAQQIKDGSMSNKTQKVMLKFDNNGQWTIQNAGEVKSRKVEGINPPLRADKFKDNNR